MKSTLKDLLKSCMDCRDRMDCMGRDTETGKTRLWSLRTCLRAKPFACPGLRLVGILWIAMDSRRRWQTVCCRWCPPNSQMVFAGKAARFVSVYEAGWVSSCQVIHWWVGIHGGNVLEGRVPGTACYMALVGLSCPSFSTLKDFLRRGVQSRVASITWRWNLQTFFRSNFHLSLLLTRWCMLPLHHSHL